MATDLALLRAWLASIDGDDFIALPPPTSRNGPTDAAEVHEQAFEFIDARGLSKDTPYIGGHTQSEAFNSRGKMVGVLELQHSGHLEAIQQRLATIPDHFEVSGGTSAKETFAIGLRFVAEAIDLNDEKAVSRVVDTLSRGGWWANLHLGDAWDMPNPRLHGVTLTPDRMEWLHTALAHGGYSGSLHERIAELIDSADALTEAELDTLLAEALTAPGDCGRSAHTLVNALYLRGRVDDAVKLALAVAPGPGEEYRPHDCELLIFAPDPRTLARAREVGALPEAEVIAAALGG